MTDITMIRQEVSELCEYLGEPKNEIPVMTKQELERYLEYLKQQLYLKERRYF